MTIRTEKIITILTKILFVWILFQFLAHTIVTFKIGFDSSIMWVIWAWKEILVILWWAFALYVIYKNKERKKKDIVWYMLIAYVILVVYALLDTLIKWIWIVRFLKAWKYDFIWFMIFFVAYFASFSVRLVTLEKFVPRTMRVVKHLLIWAIIWYMILLVKPWFFKLFGYDRMSIEWEVGEAPPAVYWTREFEWLPRNQFLFERPISRWFFLTAFFPLFFVTYLQKRSLKKTWFRWFVYALNVIVTYSRAAWWSWIIELAILWVITYRKRMWFFLKKVLAPMIILLWIITRLAKDHVINREFSNTWHIQLFLQWWEYFSNNRLFWMWAWSVGPASHRLWGLAFNPENQFLQIAIEFWIIGFIWWMLIYLWFHFLWYAALAKNRNNRHIPQHIWDLIAASIGILWLSISGMVLHSFTDRMIVYPFMALFWIIYYIYRHTHTKKESK
jgi:hypothetical protein